MSSSVSPFAYPPDGGYADAQISYYAVFLAVQLSLAVYYFRVRAHWPTFLAVNLFLIFEILFSVGYLKLHFAPVLGNWYTMWIFGGTVAPTFLIAGMHWNVSQAMRMLGDGEQQIRWSFIVSSRTYLLVALGIDVFSLLLQIIGIALIGRDASAVTSTTQPGFNVQAVAMAVQSVGLLIMIPVTFQLVLASRPRQEQVLEKSEKEVEEQSARGSACASQGQAAQPKLLHAFLGILLTNEVLVLARTICRIVDLAGGVYGPLVAAPLISAESLLLFVVIILYTVVPPVAALR